MTIRLLLTFAINTLKLVYPLCWGLLYFVGTSHQIQAQQTNPRIGVASSFLPATLILSIPEQWQYVSEPSGRLLAQEKLHPESYDLIIVAALDLCIMASAFERVNRLPISAPLAIWRRHQVSSYQKNKLIVPNPKLAPVGRSARDWLEHEKSMAYQNFHTLPATSAGNALALAIAGYGEAVITTVPTIKAALANGSLPKGSGTWHILPNSAPVMYGAISDNLGMTEKLQTAITSSGQQLPTLGYNISTAGAPRCL